MVHAQLLKRAINRRITDAAAVALAEEALRQALLQAALKHGGTLSVTQGVMATENSLVIVEQVLEAMAGSGYVSRRNHPVTGVIAYVGKEML